MSKLNAVRAAYRRGGAREVVDTSRRWVAQAIDPVDVVPAPRAPRPAPVPRTPRATDVRFVTATRFFEARRSGYEALAEALRPHLDLDGTLLDVGGNIGYFTKVVGERTGFRGHAHLFEPLPHLAGMIHRTLEGAAFDTTVHQYGLSERDDTLDIFIADNGNLGWNTMVEEIVSEDMQAVPIKVRRYADIGLQVTPSVVKIDVEGAEYRVLRGMLPAIATWQPRPVILCEVGWGSGHPAWQEELEVFAELTGLGYRPVTLAGEPVEIATLDRTTDLLFLPTG
jgi:FkbM family methyltransferase